MRHKQGARTLGMLAVAGVLAATAVSVISSTPASAAPAKAGRQAAPSVPNSAALTQGHTYRHGVLASKNGVKIQSRPAAQSSPAADQLTFDGLQYFGGTNGVGVVTGQPKVYVIYWGSQWGTQTTNAKGDLTFSGDPAGMAPVQQEFLKGLGSNHEAWSRANSQYCQGVAFGATTCPASSAHVAYPTPSQLAGVWYDNATAVSASPTALDLRQEAISAASHFNNTTAALNAAAQYIIVSPTGIRPDGWDPASNSSFCAWHDDTDDPALGAGANSPNGNIAFTNMPYLPEAGVGCGANFVNSGTAGLLDGISIVGGHEYTETLTDPFPIVSSATAALPTSGGWLAPITDTTTNTVVGAEEASDLCAWILPGAQGGAKNLSLSTGSFPVQGLWSNDDVQCETARTLADFNNDGNRDIAGVDANNDLRLYRGKGDGTLDTTSGALMWPGGGLWNSFKQVEAGDFNNDGHTDVFGIDANNDLRLYKGKGDGTLDTTSGTLMWPGGGHWGGFKFIVAGDFDRDGNVDVAGIDANNDLRLYRGKGDGTLDTTSGTLMWQSGGLWRGFKQLEAGDYNHDSGVDIIGIDANNDLHLYYGDGTGALFPNVSRYIWPTGGLWNSFKHIVAGDFNNDGFPDVAGIDANNDMRLYVNSGDGLGDLDTSSGRPMWPTGGLWGGFKFTP